MFGFKIGIKLFQTQKIPRTRLFRDDMIITSGWRLLIDQLFADSNRMSPFSTFFVTNHLSSRTNWSSGWTKSVSGRLLPREYGLEREREKLLCTNISKSVPFWSLRCPGGTILRQLGGKLGNLKDRRFFFCKHLQATCVLLPPGAAISADGPFCYMLFSVLPARGLVEERIQANNELIGTLMLGRDPENTLWLGELFCQLPSIDWAVSRYHTPTHQLVHILPSFSIAH